MAHEARKGPEPPDIAERGGMKNGQPQRSDERVFMQLLAYGGCRDSRAVAEALASAGVEGALYEDANDPGGIGILSVTRDPNFFVDLLRPVLNGAQFLTMSAKPELTMLGRTYALGYEPDLAEAILHRPRRTVLNRDWPWAVWYPLRRSGRFAQLPLDEQRVILAEHGTIGMSYGAGDYAHDVRLACYGLDKNDNDFVIGLLGKDLYPLSHIVQAMRKTQQTSLYLDRLGPFFVGRVIWQSPSE